MLPKTISSTPITANSPQVPQKAQESNFPSVTSTLQWSDACGVAASSPITWADAVIDLRVGRVQVPVGMRHADLTFAASDRLQAVSADHASQRLRLPGTRHIGGAAAWRGPRGSAKPHRSNYASRVNQPLLPTKSLFQSSSGRPRLRASSLPAASRSSWTTGLGSWRLCLIIHESARTPEKRDGRASGGRCGPKSAEMINACKLLFTQRYVLIG